MNRRSGMLIATGTLLLGLTASLTAQANTTTLGHAVGVVLAGGYHDDARRDHYRDHRYTHGQWGKHMAKQQRKQAKRHAKWHRKQERQHWRLHQQDRHYGGHDFARHNDWSYGYDGRRHDGRGDGRRSDRHHDDGHYRDGRH